MEAELALDTWEDLVGSGVMKKVVVDGEGPFPDLGSLVLFNWKGTVLLKDGTAGFTFAERAGVEARIGDADEIPGLELALRHMRVGQQCLIRCESRFAYGPDGCPATKAGDKALPPNSDIELLVELLGVVSNTPVSDMTPEEAITEGKRKKAAGNGHFERAAYKKALRSYTSACNIVAALELPDQDSGVYREARQVRIDCGNNVATTCVRLGELEKAKEAAVDVLELDPVNVKALFRAGQVSSLQSNFDEAKMALRKALNLSPESKDIKAELGRLSSRIKAYQARKQAMQETMGRALFSPSTGERNDPQVNGDDSEIDADASGQAAQLDNVGRGGAIGAQDREKAKNTWPFAIGRFLALPVSVLVALGAWGAMFLIVRWATR